MTIDHITADFVNVRFKANSIRDGDTWNNHPVDPSKYQSLKLLV